MATIRNADLEDAVVVAHLIWQLGYDIDADTARHRLVQLFARPDNAVYVAEEDGIVIGLIHVGVQETLEHELRGEIRALVVDESHRSGGTGNLLLAAAERWVSENGMKKMRVRSNVIRERARKFYERNGYTITKTQNVFDKSVTS